MIGSGSQIAFFQCIRLSLILCSLDLTIAWHIHYFSFSINLSTGNDIGSVSSVKIWDPDGVLNLIYFSDSRSRLEYDSCVYRFLMNRLVEFHSWWDGNRQESCLKFWNKLKNYDFSNLVWIEWRVDAKFQADLWLKTHWSKLIKSDSSDCWFLLFSICFNSMTLVVFALLRLAEDLEFQMLLIDLVNNVERFFKLVKFI